MKVKKAVLLVSKIVLGSLCFFAGIILGSMLAGALGLAVPPIPAGADAGILMQYQWGISVLFTCTLAVVSRNLRGSYVTRFLILSWLCWLAYSVNTYLEAALFTTNGGASSFTLVMQFAAIVLTSALIAWLFPSAEKDTDVATEVRIFVGQYRLTQWGWRLLLAWLAFPVTYVLFGWVAQPFVISYYEQQLAGLTAPGWGAIIPVLFLRSLLFLLACLPVVIFWQKPRRHLFFTFSTVLFILVGGLYMVQSYWYPLTMRIVHSLEIMADSFIYVGALVFLLTKKAAHHDEQPTGSSKTLFKHKPIVTTLLTLNLFILMLGVGCTGFKQEGRLTSPRIDKDKNEKLVAEVDLSARPHEEEILGELTLTETAAVTIFYTLPNVNTPYFDLSLIGPEDENRVILHSESYRTDESGGGTWEQNLPPGTYRLVLTAVPGSGVLSVYWGYTSTTK